jgi:hypothetical protein
MIGSLFETLLDEVTFCKEPSVGGALSSAKLGSFRFFSPENKVAIASIALFLLNVAFLIRNIARIVAWIIDNRALPIVSVVLGLLVLACLILRTSCHYRQ